MKEIPTNFAFALPQWQLPVYLQSPWMLPAALAVAALLTAAVFWLYPRQVGQVRGGWRWAIPGVRVAALIALAISLARPVLLHSHPADEQGVVLVLVDRSRSMSLSDAGRRPTDLVALADGLGLLSDGVRAEVTAKLSADLAGLDTAAGELLRAGADLEYARVSGRGLETAEARFRTTSDQFAGRIRKLSNRVAAEKSAAQLKELRDRVKQLERFPRSTVQAGWANELRRRVDTVAEAVVQYQSASDQWLYENNSDVRRICDAIDRNTRFDLVRTALAAPAAGLLSHLPERTTVLTFAFADDLVPITAEAPPARQPEINESDPSTAAATLRFNSAQPVMDAVPNGHATDLAASVAAALQRAQGQNVRAVVVFSDGRQTRPDGAAASVAAAGVPVFTIDAAAAGVPRDISFSDVSVPRSVFVGQNIVIRATLQGGSLTPDLSSVRVKIDDEPARPPDARDERRIRRAVQPRSVDFTLRLTKPGVHLIRLTIPPVDGEASVENNVVERWVKVLPERIQVAAYAGSPGWDFQYLRSALARRPWFDVEAAVLDSVRPRFPLTPEQILRQDVILLADVPAAALDAQQWTAVNRLVRDRGGSVILLAGEAHPPGEYRAQPQAAELLPFPLKTNPSWRLWPGERAQYRILPGRDADRPPLSEILRLEDGDVANHRWQELPALYHVMPFPVLKPNVKVLLSEPELGPILTEMRHGAGRAFLMGADETWRWRFKNGEDDQERFWLQLVRYAAEEPYAAHQGDLALDADNVAPAPGETVQVRARVFGDAAGEVKADLLRLEVIRDGRAVRSESLTETAPGSGRFRATIESIPEGDYSIELTAPDRAGEARHVQMPLHVRGGYETELRDVSGDFDRLRRLAESTGGEALRLDQIGLLPDRLAAAADTRPRITEVPLWDSPYLFGFVVACLGVEWALRKRFGLS